VPQDRQHRVFFALWPDDEIARQFDEAGRMAHQSLGGRRMRRETLHLTLAFIGDVPAERLAELRSIASSVRLPAFDLLFDRRHCLARRKLFWAAASAVSPRLRELAAALNERLKAADFRTEERPFAAHVTLLRHARCDKALPAGGLHIEWPVRDFVLVESELQPEGARYRILQRWSLDQT
jgi:RNA 2',3'-cyclic 3'-phosphodiesterase